MEKFKYLGVVPRNDAMQEEEKDIQISKAGAVMHSLHCSVVMK